jgi:uncharacterized protein (DUF427 family)
MAKETWKFDGPPTRVEPTARWVRVRAGGELVADSRRAQLLSWFGPGRLPTYCMPPEDVRADLLVPSGGALDGFLVAHDVAIGGRVLERAATRFSGVPDELAPLEGTWTFTWDGRLRWFEEALEAHVHARDPLSRVDAVPSERHIRVSVDGELLAESRRPHAVFETGLPTRWYLPGQDVRRDLLVPSATLSRCPYKGTARYWSVQVGGVLHDDLAWSYEDPVVECPRIAGLIAFFDERVDVEVDGEPVERPRTPWSR